MRIFDEDRGGWGEKVNFVDENNVFVGYDMGQSCCENADWFIQDKLWTPDQSLYGDGPETPSDEVLAGYVFDREFHETPDGGESSYGDATFDGGGMVVFKLVSEDKDDLFLHLFNVHNGYYGHGFEFGIKDGEIIESGYL